MLPIHVDPEPSTLRIVAKVVFTSATGILYFTVPIAGGKNLKALVGGDSAQMNGLIYFLSTTSSIVYTLFLYHKLGFFSLYINTLPKAAFATLALFTASSFYTAGNTGAKELGFNTDAGVTIGALNYVVRVGVLVDTAEKFPAFLTQLADIACDAIHEKKCTELLRLGVIGVTGLIFAASITDATYVVGNSIATSMGLQSTIASGFGYSAGILAAFGILPIIIMSNYKGLRELTFAAPSDMNVETDRYTFIALLLTLIAAMGTLGAIFNATGAMFGRMSGSMYLRVGEAIFATATGSTPGLAAPLRQVGAKIGNVADSLRFRFFGAPPDAVVVMTPPELTNGPG